jgi:hypothetical protein
MIPLVAIYVVQISVLANSVLLKIDFQLAIQ